MGLENVLNCFKRRLVTSTLLGSLLIGCSPDSSSPSQPNPPNNPNPPTPTQPIPPTPPTPPTVPQTHVLSSQDASSISLINSSMVQFSSPMNFNVGDVIGAGITEKTPYGILRQINSASSDKRTFDTSPSSIEQVVKEANLSFYVNLSPSSASASSSLSGISFSMASASSFYDFGVNLSNVVLFDKDGNLLFKDTVGSMSTYKRAPHAVDFVLKELADKFGENKLREGLEVKTTLDLELQNYVQQVLLERSFGFKENIPESGVIIVRPKDGGVLVIVGSVNYYAEDGEQNNIFVQRGFKISDKNFEMSLWDLARIYSVFANSGKFVDFSILSSIQDKDGRDVGIERKESLHLIEDMYKIMITEQVSTAGLKIFDSDGPSLSQVAVSYSPDYVVGVWSQKDGSGKSLALDILQRVVAKTDKDAEGGDI